MNNVGKIANKVISNVFSAAFFLFKTSKQELSPYDPEGEITEARWTTIDEALALLNHPKDREFLHDVRGKIEAC